MPELPEVETIRRQLRPDLVGRSVTNGWFHSSEKFAPGAHAVGAGIVDLRRRGKYLIAELDDDCELIVHLGMTGSLRIRDELNIPGEPPSDAYERGYWSLSGHKELVYRDVRRFGRIAVVPRGEYRTLPTLAALGPEPFDEQFTAEHLWRGLRHGTSHVKTKLLSQRPVAGIGNIYADEALWLAGINPADRRVTRPGAGRLVEAIRSVLQDGLDHGGTTLRDYVDASGNQGQNQHHLRCYGRAGQPCERCGEPLRSRLLDARTTTYCHRCQPRVTVR